MRSVRPFPGPQLTNRLDRDLVRVGPPAEVKSRRPYRANRGRQTGFQAAYHATWANEGNVPELRSVRPTQGIS